jgi:hypothetical protein
MLQTANLLANEIHSVTTRRVPHEIHFALALRLRPLGVLGCVNNAHYTGVRARDVITKPRSKEVHTRRAVA